MSETCAPSGSEAKAEQCSASIDASDNTSAVERLQEESQRCVTQSLVLPRTSRGTNRSRRFENRPIAWRASDDGPFRVDDANLEGFVAPQTNISIKDHRVVPAEA